MILLTGHKAIAASGKRGTAFTLVELMLVMALLLIVMAVSAPSLANFFRGRVIEEEARRVLSLTRYAQSRAVSEGVPMVLWIDSEERTYGLQADLSFIPDDDRQRTYQLGRDLEMEVIAGNTLSNHFNSTSDSGTSGMELRFQPDGYVSSSSAERLVLRDGDRDEIWIGLSRNRLAYEIQTNIHRNEVQMP